MNPNIFTEDVASKTISRINALTSETKAEWGKMDVSQMLAHCNVTYEMVYDNMHKKPSGFIKFMLKTFIKSKVVGESAYTKNGRTAPQFLITEAKDFEVEKTRLIDYISKTQSLGEAHFEQKESHSFGKLTSQEWNNMFYKHLNHHLSQFGAK